MDKFVYKQNMLGESQQIINCFKTGKKLFACGNGGSSAEASHLVGEFLGHFKFSNRKPLPAIALTDSTVTTAIANDYGYEHIFSRPIQALGKKGDVLIIFTTTSQGKIGLNNHSFNLLRAEEAARKKEMIIIYAPQKGDSTAQIQENQLRWLHQIAEEVEAEFL